MRHDKGVAYDYSRRTSFSLLKLQNLNLQIAHGVYPSEVPTLVGSRTKEGKCAERFTGLIALIAINQ